MMHMYLGGSRYELLQKCTAGMQDIAGLHCGMLKASLCRTSCTQLRQMRI